MMIIMGFRGKNENKKPISDTYPFEDCKECVGWKYY